MKKISSQIILWLLFFMFVFPLFLAMVFYKNPPLWMQNHSVAHGTFILKSFVFRQMKKESSAERKWQIFYLTLKPCQQACQILLKKLLNLRLAFGVKQSKIEIVLLQPTEENIPGLPDKITVYQLSEPDRTQFFSKIMNKKQAPGFYLYDTEQRIVLYYPETTSLQGIYQDLQRLL